MIFLRQIKTITGISLFLLFGLIIRIYAVDTIWVEDGYTGVESGTQAQPFNTITEAINALPPTPDRAYVILIAPGSYIEGSLGLINTSRTWTSVNNLTIKARYASVDSMPTWKGTYEWYVFRIQEEDHITIENIRFRGNNTLPTTKPCAIWIDGNVDNITVRRCYFGTYETDTLTYGINIRSGTGVGSDSIVVENCIFYRLKGAGIYNNTSSAYTHSGLRYINNTFYYCYQAYNCHNSYFNGGSDFLFANNIVVGATSGYAIYTSGPAVITLRNWLFYNIPIRNIQYGAANYVLVDCLDNINPNFVLTDSSQYANWDFLKPTLDMVIEGGLDTAGTPANDFFDDIRTSGHITIGAVNAYDQTPVAPILGHSVNNAVLISRVGLSYTVRFKINDMNRDNCTIKNFEYFNGSIWQAPANGDGSGALSSGWTNNSGTFYKTDRSYAASTEYSFTFNAGHAGVNLGILDIPDFKVRFKANDGGFDSEFGVSVDIDYDTKPALNLLDVSAKYINGYRIQLTFIRDSLNSIFGLSPDAESIGVWWDTSGYQDDVMQTPDTAYGFIALKDVDNAPFINLPFSEVRYYFSVSVLDDDNNWSSIDKLNAKQTATDTIPYIPDLVAPDNPVSAEYIGISYSTISIRFPVADLNKILAGDAIYVGVFINDTGCISAATEPDTFFEISKLKQFPDDTLEIRGVRPNRFNYISYCVGDAYGGYPNNWSEPRFNSPAPSCTTIKSPQIPRPSNQVRWHIKVPSDDRGTTGFYLTLEDTPVSNPVYHAVDIYVSLYSDVLRFPTSVNMDSVDTIYRIAGPFSGSEDFYYLSGLNSNTEYYLGLATVDTLNGFVSADWGPINIDTFKTNISCTGHPRPPDMFTKFNLVVNSSKQVTLEWSLRDSIDIDRMAIDPAVASAIDSVSFWYRTGDINIKAITQPGEQPSDVERGKLLFADGGMSGSYDITDLLPGTYVSVSAFVKDTLRISGCNRPWTFQGYAINKTDSLPANVIRFNPAAADSDSCLLSWRVTDAVKYDSMKILWSIGDSAFARAYDETGYSFSVTGIEPGVTDYSMILRSLSPNSRYSVSGFSRYTVGVWSGSFRDAQIVFDVAGASVAALDNRSRVVLRATGPSSIERMVIDTSGIAGPYNGVSYMLAYDTTRYFDNAGMFWPKGFPVKEVKSPGDTVIDTVGERVPGKLWYFTVALDTAGKDTFGGPGGGWLDSIMLSADSFQLGLNELTFEIHDYNKLRLLWDAAKLHKDFDSVGLAYGAPGGAVPSLPMIRGGKLSLDSGLLLYKVSKAFEDSLSDTLSWYAYFGVDIDYGASYWSNCRHLGDYAYESMNPGVTEVSFNQRILAPCDTLSTEPCDKHHYTDFSFRLNDGNGDRVKVNFDYVLAPGDTNWKSFHDTEYVSRIFPSLGQKLDTGYHDSFAIDLEEHFTVKTKDSRDLDSTYLNMIESDSVRLRFRLLVYKDDDFTVRENNIVVFDSFTMDLRPPHDAAGVIKGEYVQIQCASADSFRFASYAGLLNSSGWLHFNGDTLVSYSTSNMYFQFKDSLGNVDSTGISMEAEYDTIIQFRPQDTLFEFG
ncbi:MAG: right-handed parallel beta-helix repeat-containing protein, partial [bacterium]